MAQASGDCVINGACFCSSNYPGDACGPTSSASGRYGNVESCSVYSTVKRTGPVERFEDPGVLVHELAGRVEALASDRVIPEIVMPLRARFLI